MVILHRSKSRNGRITRSTRLISSLIGPVKRKIVYAGSSSNHWSSTENNSNNSWNVNFNDGNFNNNNKYNGNVVRPVVALRDEEVKSWWRAYENCCARKMSSIQCCLFRIQMERELLQLGIDVKNRTYVPSTSTCFVVSWPKYREIFAANFKDRVAQHWIILRLEPLFEERFMSQGDVSYNCRKGYGTLAAVTRLSENMRLVSEGYTKEAYVGKFDMQSFFMSIDKEVLLELLIPFIREKYKGDDIGDLIWLSTVTISHCPQTNCIKKGNLDLWDYLEPSKSLFNAPPGVGMPIGNITSQLLANFYLSFFDEYMVNLCSGFGGKFIRFVDDFVIVAPRKKDIIQAGKLAGKYLSDKLHIRLHPDKVYIQDVKKGVKFVGSVIKPGRVYLSNRTVGGFFCMLNALEDSCRRILFEHDKYDVWALLKNLEHFISSANSYMGFLIHCSTYAIRTKAINSLGYFWGVCEVDQKTKVIKLKDKFKLKNYFYGKDKQE